MIAPDDPAMPGFWRERSVSARSCFNRQQF